MTCDLWKEGGYHIEQGQLQLPSWSWAGTARAKRWVSEIGYGKNVVELLPRTLELITTGDSSGSIMYAGHIVELVLTLYDINSDFFNKIYWAMRAGRWILPQVSDKIGRGEGYRSGLPYFILDQSFEEIFLGIVVFDEDHHTIPAKFFLIKRRHISSVNR